MPFLGLVFAKELKEAEQNIDSLNHELTSLKEKSESEIQTLNQTITCLLYTSSLVGWILILIKLFR